MPQSRDEMLAKKREAQRLYVAADRERIQRQRRKDRERSREKRRAYQADYRARNPHVLTEWRKRNAAHIIEYDRTRIATKPEVHLAKIAKRRARILMAEGSGITRTAWKRIVSDAGGLCSYCGQQKPLHLDHIEPLCRGGMHDESNVTPSCQSCNSSKHKLSLLHWLAKRAQKRFDACRRFAPTIRPAAAA